MVLLVSTGYRGRREGREEGRPQMQLRCMEASMRETGRVELTPVKSFQAPKLVLWGWGMGNSALAGAGD